MHEYVFSLFCQGRAKNKMFHKNNTWYDNIQLQYRKAYQKRHYWMSKIIIIVLFE